jgi:hypothetical protein
MSHLVTTEHDVMRKQKPLQANGWFATAVLVAVTLAGAAVRGLQPASSFAHMAARIP